MAELRSPTMQGKGLLLIIAAGLALGAGVLSAISLGVAWGDFDSGGGKISYGANAMDVSGGGFSAAIDYSDEAFDDEAGAGLLRGGGPVLLVGVILAFVTLVALAANVFIRAAFIELSSVIAGALAFLMVGTANVLLPLGIDKQATDSGFEIAWASGLILASIASAFLLGATILALIGRGPQDA